MYFTDKTDFLAHYGVMGMKWGVRKYKDTNSFGPRFNKRYNKLLTKIERANKTNNSKEIIKNQRKAAKLSSRNLNKLDKKMSLYRAEISENKELKKRAERVRGTAKYKEKNKKALKASKQIQKYDELIKDYNNLLEKGSKHTEYLLKNAKHNGVTIKDIKVTRSVQTKQNRTNTRLDTLFGTYGLTPHYTFVSGTQYKAAKKPKKK